MASLKTFLACAMGPRLNAYFKINGRSLTEETPSALLSSNRYYQRNQLEQISDNILRVTNIALHMGVYISPIILSYCIYKRSFPITIGAGPNEIFLVKLFTTFAAMLLATYLIRGYGRYTNPDYLSFLKVLNKAQINPTVSTKRILNHYDFDFEAWPVEYRWKDSKSADLKDPPTPYQATLPPAERDIQTNESLVCRGMRFTLEFISTVVMTTFGRRMIYPGSMSFFQIIMQPAILVGRAKLVEEYGGKRYKLIACDDNYIDSMFVDRRNGTPNGDTLVIGCEGNGGFYELGVLGAPLESGYSVLGWNHPGFGGSSGVPYPSQEVAAVDVVIKFAIEKLGFKQESIIMHGWSIGGFTATWAAMRYPKIGGLIIDASFDHILPLALNLMPRIISPLTTVAIKKHFDLDNSRHLKYYDGPVLLIRRSQDEVIATDPYDSLRTNRANNLLLNLLKHRFPILIDTFTTPRLMEYLTSKTDTEVASNFNSISEKRNMRHLLDYFRTSPTSYPVNIGPSLDTNEKTNLAIFLASKFLVDYDSLHCAPLPPEKFQRPWDLITTCLRSSNL